MRTLRRLIVAKELPVVRLGRLVRVHPDDLARFIAARRSLGPLVTAIGLI